MKTLKLFAVLLMTTSLSFAQDTDTESKKVTIEITIDNLRNEKGQVVLALHTKDTFMKGKGIANVLATVEGNVAKGIFDDVAPGSYAILALHDENSNGRMDFDSSGMPLEDFGSSNNVMVMGPPTYEDAEFTVNDKNLNLNIRF
ncbi:DUF2141 domain-containing protein [Ascidiimonas aurantiaca]|uniref:DUF2141 domain-containing protein n=1 Tax=Ascidiimonas aurantiaca TaxID=1685432 RepID=UPI0030EEB06C